MSNELLLKHWGQLVSHLENLTLGQAFTYTGYATTVVFTLGIVYFTALFFYQCHVLRAFRGPLAIPLVGNCYQSEALYLLRYLSRLRKRFGKVFTFFAFTKPYLVVCDPLAVRRILSDTKAFVKGVDYTNQFSVAFGEGLVTSNGEKHRKDRATFGKYFIRSNICKYMEKVNLKTKDAIAGMLSSGVHNIEHFFALLSLRVFMAFAIGYDFGERPQREEELCKAVSNGSWAVGRMITLGLPMWDIFPAVAVIRTGREELWRDMQEVVENRKAMLARGEGLDIDDCLAAMINERMNDKDMLDHLTTLLSAGHDTTAYFAAYMCFLLASHQDIQDRLRAEVISTVFKDGSMDMSAINLTGDDVGEMKYMQKVMQETLRLYSIIPCVSRLAAYDVHIKEANVTIPAGANLLIPMFLINRDPELWENPSEFNPERFEGRGAEFTSAKNGYFPFGYGTRTCIGNTLAQVGPHLSAFSLFSSPSFLLSSPTNSDQNPHHPSHSPLYLSLHPPCSSSRPSSWPTFCYTSDSSPMPASSPPSSPASRSRPAMASTSSSFRCEG